MAQLKQTVTERFGVEFRMFGMTTLNGNKAHPVYQYLRTNGPLNSKRVGWNFGKFLVDREGKVVDYKTIKTKPLQMKADIEKLLQ